MGTAPPAAGLSLRNLFHHKWLVGAFWFFLTGALFFSAVRDLPLIRSEAMYALVPKEMGEAGTWLTPTLNGARYLDKPPLLYWVNLLAYKLGGVSETTARIPTLMAAAGEVGLTYLVGIEVLGPRPAFWGSLVLLTSVGFFALHLQLLTDHLVTLSLLVALYVMLLTEGRLASGRPAGSQPVFFQMALAAGFLSKGLIGLVFPLMILAGYSGLRRNAGLLSLVLNPRGWLVFLLLSLPWLGAMEYHHPGFLRHHILNEQILRFLGERQPPDINSFSLGGFWLFLFLWLLPWGLLLPEALYCYVREAWRSSLAFGREGLMPLWAAVVLLFFSLSSSRIEYYSLPALPPLALILGWRLSRIIATPGDRRLPLVLFLLGFLGLATLLLLPHLEELCAANRREFFGMFPLIQPWARQVTYIVPGLSLTGVVLGWRRPRVALAFYGTLALVLLFFTWKTYLALSPLLSDKIFGEYLRKAAAPGNVVVMEAIEEFEYGASLAFYSGRRILMVQRRGLPQFAYAVSPRENFLISATRLEELWRSPSRVYLLVDEAILSEVRLPEGILVQALPGKRLLSNRP